MKRTSLAGFCLLASLCIAQAQSPVTVIRAGTLIDGASATPREDQVIVIRGNRIESVGDAASAKVPAEAKVLDLSNATVLPGLIDAHTHIFLQGEIPAEGGYDAQLLKHGLAFRAARAAVSARRALEQGFTTIRDVETEGAGYGDVGIRQAIEGGYIPGPRMFVVTRAISTSGGYPLEGYAPEITVPKGVQIVDGPVEAERAQEIGPVLARGVLAPPGHVPAEPAAVPGARPRQHHRIAPIGEQMRPANRIVGRRELTKHRRFEVPGVSGRLHFLGPRPGDGDVPGNPESEVGAGHEGEEERFAPAVTVSSYFSG